MQPTNPEPSSAEPPADTEAAEASSEQSTPASRNFLQRLFRGRGSQEPEPQDQPDEAPASDAVTLTQEELDRRVQAETDRRERVRVERAAAERKRKLRDEDPWAYAEEERTAERQAEIDAQNTAWMGNVGATHDRFTIDPVVMTLPESERNRIMNMPGAGVGLDGRKLVITESLKALEKQWKAEAGKEAEEKLRRNPAFRKQILNEFRRGAASEPEFIGGGAPSASDSSVSNILREQLRARH